MMKHLWHSLSVCLAMCFLATAFMTPPRLAALDREKDINRFDIRKWDTGDGLPGNSIYAILQAGNDYLWLGTSEGLVRFDGTDFLTFNSENTPQLKDNTIRALYEDCKGVLHIGTNSGGLTSLRDGNFITLTTSKYKFLEMIYAINEDRWGNLWIGSFKYGLFRLNSGTEFTPVRTGSLPNNQVRAIEKDGNGDLWITTTAGIVKMTRPGQFQHVIPEPLNAYFTTCRFEISDRTLWVGSGDKGLICLRMSADGNFNIVNTIATNAGLPNVTVNCLFKDMQGSLWLGCDSGGPVRMIDGAVTVMAQGHQLARASISTIYQDREGSLWIGTLDHGLHQLRDTPFVTLSTVDGLLDDSVTCFYEDSSGIMWIGTDGGLNRLSNGIPRSVLNTSLGLRDDRVLALLEDSNGSFWIGTYGGLHRLTGQILTAFTKEDGLSENRVRCLMQDHTGDLWIGTTEGLNRREPHGAITVYTTQDGLASNFIEFLYQDSVGTIYIGTERGLSQIHKDIITPVPVHKGVDNSRFRCFHRDGSGTYWFGTDSGLVRLRNHQSHRFTVNSGLKENYIYTIHEDDRGRLWLGGRSGVSYISKQQFDDFAIDKIKTLAPTSFDENDGMISRWITRPGYKTRDGRLWFPTSRGAAIVQPNRAEKKRLPPTTMIDKLVVDGETVGLHTDKPRLLKLPPGKKRLEISYTGIGFTDPKRIIYQLKLDNYDNDWVPMGTARSTTYTNLSPGKYTFQVRASYPGDPWSGKQATFTFYLEPRFYQTFWFYLLAVLAIVAGYFLRIQQLKRRERQLKSLVELRTMDLKERNAELQRAQDNLHRSKELIEDKNRLLEAQSRQLQELDRAKSRFFTNISHEFRTPLTLILGPLEQIISDTEDKELKNKARLMIRNSRRLLTLVNQLLELSRLDSGKMKLQTSQQDIIPFIRHTVGFFDSLSQKSRVALTLLTDEHPIPVYFDSEKLEKIITNLLSNAFNHTPPGGTITVTVRKMAESDAYPSGSTEVSVQDTGVGIPREQLPHIFDRFYRGSSTHDYKREGTGIGLALTKELVELHHGHICVESNPGTTGGNGTRFALFLPLGSDHLMPGESIDASDADVPESLQDLIGDIEAEFSQGIQAPGREEETKSHHNKPAVLVVEDSDDVRKHIRQSLAPHFEIVEASNGTDGIKKAKAIIPDLVISDVMMPGSDGYQLCRTLKNNVLTSHIPVILVTAKVSDTGTLEGLAAGADDYITKPFSTAILTARAVNLMELRRQLHLEQSNRMALQPGEMKVSSIDRTFYNTLQKTVEYHLSDPDFNVDAFSRTLDMSHATLYRKVNALTGSSPNQFIRSYRLKRAVQMLQEGTGNIAAIARRTGFQDPSYFARCFKEQFHSLPSDHMIRSGANSEGTESILNSPPPETTTGTGEQQKSNDRDIETDVILVVEDNLDARTYIRGALEPAYRVVEAEDGDKGISMAMETIPDLIVSDIMMPGSDGYQLCTTLKKDLRTSHIPIILLTAKASEESIIQGLETGADDYVTKPFNTAMLLTRIKNLIRLRSHLQKKRHRELTLMPSKIAQSQLDNRFIKKLNRVMEKNLSNSDFNVEQLAKSLYMSSATLYRKLHALTGKIPSRYIRSYRLQTAARLIRENFGTITEVAFEVGFTSRAYFTRCFKEEFHMAPSDYRESVVGSQ